MQVAEVVAEVLLQAQTDVLVEVAGDPEAPPQSVDSAVAQAGPPALCTPPFNACLSLELLLLSFTSALLCPALCCPGLFCFACDSALLCGHCTNGYPPMTAF